MRDAVAAAGRTVMMPSEYEAVNKGYLSTVKDAPRGRLSDTRPVRDRRGERTAEV